MEQELLAVEWTYNSEGFLVKCTANNFPIFIPKQEFPSVKFIGPEVEWVTEKIVLSKEEFKNKFRHLPVDKYLASLGLK